MKPAPSCTKCSSPLAVEHFNSGQYAPCPKCASELRVEVLPAFFREEARGSSGEVLLVDSESSCFFHPNKKAAVVCSSCGRFLCALCDFELENAHFCAGCLENAKEKGKIAAIENNRKVYDSFALQLALIGFLPIVCPYLVLFTSIGAVYYSIRYWNAPTTIVRTPSHWRQIVALIVGGLQLIAIIVMASMLAYEVLK